MPGFKFVQLQDPFGEILSRLREIWAISSPATAASAFNHWAVHMGVPPHFLLKGFTSCTAPPLLSTARARQHISFILQKQDLLWLLPCTSLRSELVGSNVESRKAPEAVADACLVYLALQRVTLHNSCTAGHRLPVCPVHCC